MDTWGPSAPLCSEQHLSPPLPLALGCCLDREAKLSAFSQHWGWRGGEPDWTLSHILPAFLQKGIRFS
jgi:hypothetical protein